MASATSTTLAGEERLLARRAERAAGDARRSCLAPVSAARRSASAARAARAPPGPHQRASSTRWKRPSMPASDSPGAAESEHHVGAPGGRPPARRRRRPGSCRRTSRAARSAGRCRSRGAPPRAARSCPRVRRRAAHLGDSAVVVDQQLLGVVGAPERLARPGAGSASTARRRPRSSPSARSCSGRRRRRAWSVVAAEDQVGIDGLERREVRRAVTGRISVDAAGGGAQISGQPRAGHAPRATGRTSSASVLSSASTVSVQRLARPGRAPCSRRARAAPSAAGRSPCSRRSPTPGSRAAETATAASSARARRRIGARTALYY